MKRIILRLTVAAFMVAALLVSAAGAFAAAPECGTGEPSDHGCKTLTTTTTTPAGKSDNAFKTQSTTSQRGNIGAQGTADTAVTSDPVCVSNPGGQPHGCH